MGCKNSKVITREKQEQEIKEAKRRQSSALRESSRKAKQEKSSTTSVPKPVPSKPIPREIFEEMVSDKDINNTKKAVGGVAFDIGTTDLPKKPPKKITKKSEEPKEDLAITYSAEEKALMAEILKEEEAKEKAWNAELKRDKVKRRKMFLEAEKAYNAQMKQDKKNSDK